MHRAPALEQRASPPACPAPRTPAPPPRSEAVAYALYMTTNTFLAAAVVAAVLFYGGTLVLRGAMSAGSLVSFMLFQQSLSSAFQVGGAAGWGRWGHRLSWWAGLLRRAVAARTANMAMCRPGSASTRRHVGGCSRQAPRHGWPH